MRLGVLLLWAGAAMATVSELSKKAVKPSFPTFDDHLFSVNGAAVRKAHPHFSLEKLHKPTHALYEKVGRASVSELHELIFVIKSHNLGKLEELVHDISNPSSINYGDFLSHQELVELTSNLESAEHVQNYLLQIPGMESVHTTEHADYVVAKAPISVWEDHLHCQFHVYELKQEHKPSRLAEKPVHVLRSTEYYVETPLAGHVDFVFNTIHFPPPPSAEPVHSSIQPKVSAEDILLSGYVTPDLLVKTYGIDRNLGNNKVDQAVYATGSDTYFSPSDLTSFFNYFSLPPNDALQVGGTRGDDYMCSVNFEGCTEGNLDLQYIMSTAPHVPTTFYYWPGPDFLLDMLIQVNNLTAPPEVLSISYGTYEAYISPSYAASFNVQAMKLAARGTTLVAASGDDGVAGQDARYDSMQCGYRPIFPASSPYVLAVGGSMGPEKGGVEVACQGDKGGIITSGGGFSNLYPTPDYQQAAVTSYLTSTLSSPPQGGYNRGGRAYPDISALAANYVIFLNQGLMSVSGTSASAPLVAGMLSLINAARSGVGKGTLGELL
ncbi:hypothetical protein EON64_03960 [archaeon]|nr:MAG: hypothetical protein EON64_03960 [archaeon]